MRLADERDILRIVTEDEWMMDVLRAAQSLRLPDWWVCAGFVRSKIWDALHGFAERTPLPDVDVVYFDPVRTDESEEKELERRLRRLLPDVPWSVKNEARMHVVNDLPPYSSAVDAISKFPETATALGLSLDERGRVRLAAPHGVEDVLRMKLKPTPLFATPALSWVYEERVDKKDWKSRWPMIEVARMKR